MNLILLLLIIILLFSLRKENFTGFRKLGFLTETKNDETLFPYVIHNKKIKRKCIKKMSAYNKN